MNLFAAFQGRISAILARMVEEGRLPADLDTTRFVVEPPRDPSHGDLATNAALVYAKEAKAHFANPRQLASEIAFEIAEAPDVVGAEVAGAGFINIRLKPDALHDVVRAVLADGKAYGRPDLQPGRVNVEYVSANPTGPMHVGHGRGAVFGDALANLLAFAGQTVTREYYINDAGAQVDVLARSAFLRYREALGQTIGDVPEGLYPGDYLKPVGASLARQHGRSLLDMDEAVWLPIVRAAAIDAMMDLIRDDLQALNIRHEVFFSERSLTEPHGNRTAIDVALDDLATRGLIYEGRLEPPKGAAIEDWEDRQQTLFRSTAFGDDVDRPLRKSDGSQTYFASDIAYHKNKIDRGFTSLIDVMGADHGGYVKRMTAAVRALSDGSVTLDVKLCQLVKLLRAGEPVENVEAGR